MIPVGDIPTEPFTQPNTIRLIPQAYIQEPAMDPLVDGEVELDFLAAFERLTSGRQNETIPLPADVLPSELLTAAHGYGYSYVNSAFCYTRSTGNRFNGSARGAWYATYGDNAVETAQAEVAYHLGRELYYTGVFDNITTYRELIAGFTTAFHSLNNLGILPALDPDPETAYLHGQQLAQHLRAIDSAGILYPSARYDGGACLVAFRTNLVQNIRQGDGWLFEWQGSTTPTIQRM